MPLTTPPGFWVTLLTLGIARALWISRTNRDLGRGGAGFLFAYFLQPFANYGLAGRLNTALGEVGSSHRISPFWAFWLTGFPFIGTRHKMKRAVVRLNDAQRVRQAAVAA